MQICSEVMTRNPVCCVATDSADKVAQIMRNEDVGSIPVVESDLTKKLVGIVTDRDLAMTVVADGRDPRNTPIQTVMTRNPIACYTEDDVNRAFEAMAQHQVRRIPVVDQSYHVVGIIAQADVALRTDNDGRVGQVVEEISKPDARIKETS